MRVDPIPSPNRITSQGRRSGAVSFPSPVKRRVGQGKDRNNSSLSVKKSHAVAWLFISMPRESLDLNPLPGNIPRDFVLEVAGRVIEVQLERSGLRIPVVAQIDRLTQVDGP